MPCAFHKWSERVCAEHELVDAVPKLQPSKYVSSLLRPDQLGPVGTVGSWLLWSRVAEATRTGAQVDALFAEFGDSLTEARYALAAKEGIRANAAWLDRNAAPLCAWLGVQ